jgi:hypothetical protein
MSKKLIYVNLGRGMGKTSIALTEYHKFKQQGESVNILITDYKRERSLIGISDRLRIPINKKDIIIGDDIMGRNMDRLIIDDADELIESIMLPNLNVPFVDFFDRMFMLTNKILFTSSHITNFELKDYLYKRKDIEWTHYTEADLKGYKFGV